MEFIRKGIAKLGVLTMIVVTTVCLAAVVLLVRLSDTVPNIMLSPFMQSCAGEEEPTILEEGRSAQNGGEHTETPSDILRSFVEENEGISSKEDRAVLPRRAIMGDIRTADLKNAVKRTE